MRSVIQRKSCGSVKIFWRDRALLRFQLREAAEALCHAHPQVHKVYLFGSVAANTDAVFSDVDLLIIVEHSSKRFIDRSAEFRHRFEGMGVNPDLFVYTQREIRQGNEIVENAISTGILLAESDRG